METLLSPEETEMNLPVIVGTIENLKVSVKEIWHLEKDGAYSKVPGNKPGNSQLVSITKDAQDSCEEYFPTESNSWTCNEN